jgi:hypothetical protein
MLGRFCWHDDGVQRCPVSLQGLSAARPVNVTVDKSHEETSTHLKLSASQTAGKFLRWINQVRSLAVGSALSVPAFTTDFFLSRRGSVAPTASEIADVLRDEGCNVTVQDYDFRLGASSVEATHDAIKAAGDLVVLFTADYEKSPFTRKEFTSFEADRAQSSDGALLRDQGDLVSARPLLERALAAGRRRHGNGPRGVESPASAARRSCSGSTIIGTCARNASCFGQATSRTDCRSLKLRWRLMMSAWVGIMAGPKIQPPSWQGHSMPSTDPRRQVGYVPVNLHLWPLRVTRVSSGSRSDDFARRRRSMMSGVPSGPVARKAGDRHRK